MTFTFRPAVRDKTSLLIAIAGASGSGKTFSALRLATGLAGTGKIAFIDTEAGRGLHYADAFRFDHGELTEPFTPERYIEAILAARDAGAEVIVVDSLSHEYEGVGGLMDIQHADLERMSQGDTRKMERLTAPAWKNAKTRHKKMMARLLQVRAHLIFCLRAEEKIRFEKVKDGNGYEKTVIVPAGWVPITEKRFMYEMTLSVTLSPEQPGVPLADADGNPIHGKIQDQHRAAFPAGGAINETSGAALARWAEGGSIDPGAKTAAPPPSTDPTISSAASNEGEKINTGPAEPADDTLFDTARDRASDGGAAFQDWYPGLTSSEKERLKDIGPELRQRMDAADARAREREEADG